MAAMSSAEYPASASTASVSAPVAGGGVVTVVVRGCPSAAVMRIGLAGTGFPSTSTTAPRARDLRVVDERRALVHEADGHARRSELGDPLGGRAGRERLGDPLPDRVVVARAPGRPAARSSRPSPVQSAVHVRGSSAAVVTHRPSPHW